MSFLNKSMVVNPILEVSKGDQLDHSSKRYLSISSFVPSNAAEAKANWIGVVRDYTKEVLKV